MWQKCAFLVSFFILMICSCKSESLPIKKLEIQTASGEIVSVKAEIADSQESRQRGFMFRKNIPDGTGMLFVFENDQILQFWMKNTPHPLSIAYISSDGSIRDIFDMTPYSLSDVTSTSYVRYALEVPQGWFKKSGVAVGDRVIIPHLQ
ncbi:MAG: DUF192 domain-containing protein [Treponema sp.]|nr:DUF192 domain-containing protein [Treponema sp.]MBD5442958.1 DUF192 domain-containing protein [Treponema sp.]